LSGRDKRGRFVKGHRPWSAGKTKDIEPRLSGGRRPGIPNYSARLNIEPEEILKVLQRTRNYRKTAKHFGCSKPTVRNILRRNGITPPKFERPRSVWTEERIEELRRMYPTIPTREVAEYFKTTEMNIIKQAENFGIKKIRKQHPNRTSTHKYCSGCKQWKPHSEFWKNKYGNPASECKLCNNKRKMNYVRRNPDKELIWRKRYYQKHRDEIIKKVTDFYKKRPELRKLYNKRWMKRNPDKYKAVRARREKRKKDGNISSDDILRLLIMFKKYGCCPICDKVVDGKRRAWWLEHDIPLSRGGKHELSNVIYDCNICNMKKGTKTLKEFCGMTVDGILEKVQKEVKEKVA